MSSSVTKSSSSEYVLFVCKGLLFMIFSFFYKIMIYSYQVNQNRNIINQPFWNTAILLIFWGWAVWCTMLRSLSDFITFEKLIWFSSLGCFESMFIEQLEMFLKLLIVLLNLFVLATILLSTVAISSVYQWPPGIIWLPGHLLLAI